MFKTILALLIIGAPVAYIIQGMFMYPIFMWSVIYAAGVCVFILTGAWAINHIHSKFTSKETAK
jgi:hypothetical protein